MFISHTLTLFGAPHGWPDGFDATVTALFMAAIIGTVVLGYIFMVLDYRAYLRSLRRALVRVVNYLPHIPEWAKVETPRSLTASGLTMPCTEEDLLHAYRKRVKNLHPDRGGDKKKFLVLQQNFEEAGRYLAEYERLRASGRG
jgi:hypothetical protein